MEGELVRDNLLWVAGRLDEIDDCLLRFKLTGQVVAGPNNRSLFGNIYGLPFIQKVKLALDPNCIFDPK